MAKTPADIRSLARNHTAKALSTLASIMNQRKAPAAARVAAAQALLDRGWGKPTQPVDMRPEDERDLSELSTAELLARTTRILAEIEGGNRGAGTGENPSPDLRKLN